MGTFNTHLLLPCYGPSLNYVIPMITSQTHTVHHVLYSILSLLSLFGGGEAYEITLISVHLHMRQLLHYHINMCNM
jgi:hypothetical protein